MNLRESIVIAQLEDQIVVQLVRPDHAEYSGRRLGRVFRFI